MIERECQPRQCEAESVRPERLQRIDAHGATKRDAERERGGDDEDPDCRTERAGIERRKSRHLASERGDDQRDADGAGEEPNRHRCGALAQKQRGDGTRARSERQADIGPQLVVSARPPCERHHDLADRLRPPRADLAKAHLAIACPITSHAKGYPLEVALPDGGKVTGAVLADHVKNLDWNARRVEFAAAAPVEVLTDVRERLRVLLGL